MNKDMFKKLENEQPLTADEALFLDEVLEGESANVSLLAMGGLSEDSPSLAWRSGLNVELAKVSRRRRSLVFLRYGIATGAVAAACASILMLVRPSEQPAPVETRIAQESTVEDAIFSEHESMMGNASLGVHVSFNDSGS
jgi:hypothetical protein